MDAGLWMTVLLYTVTHTSVSDMFPTGMPETPKEEQLQDESSFLRNTIARKTSQLTHKQTFSQIHATPAEAGVTVGHQRRKMSVLGFTLNHGFTDAD